MRASPDPLFPPRTLGSDPGIWGPGAMSAACFSGCLALALVAWLRQAPARPPVPDVRPAIDALEARVISATSMSSECDRALRQATRSQRGAIVFVKGPHCHVIRDRP